MKNKIIIISIIIVLIVVGVVVAIILKNRGNDNDKTTTQKNNDQKEETISTATPENNNEEETNMNYQEAAERQMALPEEGDTVAVFHVKDFGDITVKFFPEVAPKAVENFITHAKEGYYNGVTFHRVINEFMIQGGDPQGTGYGGESIWGEGFEEELSEKLVPYRGSLCMASTGYGTSSIGSQFFITQANVDENMATMLSQYGYPSELVECYRKYGGYLSLYMQYTIFGQVIDGMDIVDKIASVETSKAQQSKDKPLTDVVIESIEVTEYK